jgi:hypothetical protein
LTATNNAGLQLIYTIPDEYKDYIAISDDGVLTCKKFTTLASGVTIPVKVSVASVSNSNYDSTETTPGYYNVSLAKDTTAEFTAEKKTLTVNTAETEASIVAAIGAKITYRTWSSAKTVDQSDNTKATVHTINLDLNNAKFEYQPSGGVYTTGRPTAEGTYKVRITYTGEEAANLKRVNNTDETAVDITLTISKNALELVDEKVSKTPTISGDTAFEGAGAVTITAATGATIYYTTDESVPTTASTKYTGAFAISKDTVVKAIAVEDGKEASTVATATFAKKVTADDPEEQ